MEKTRQQKIQIFLDLEDGHTLINTLRVQNILKLKMHGMLLASQTSRLGLAYPARAWTRAYGWAASSLTKPS